MLLIRASVDVGAMAMKGYSTFSKASALHEPHHQIFVSYPGHLLEGYYPSAKRLSVYSAVPADKVNQTQGKE